MKPSEKISETSLKKLMELADYYSKLLFSRYYFWTTGDYTLESKLSREDIFQEIVLFVLEKIEEQEVFVDTELETLVKSAVEKVRRKIKHLMSVSEVEFKEGEMGEEDDKATDLF